MAPATPIPAAKGWIRSGHMQLRSPIIAPSTRALATPNPADTMDKRRNGVIPPFPLVTMSTCQIINININEKAQNQRKICS